MTDKSEVISKRLHISGLTPAISFDDLSRRLGSFGSVTALDGLGKLDALGQPRKFAYVTLRATKPQLSRCMNALSGSTWKGAKLRIGEAKADFRERIALENAPKGTDDTRPRKRRRLARGVHGRHTPDMSLTTPENIHQRPQWRLTPLGTPDPPNAHAPRPPTRPAPPSQAPRQGERERKGEKGAPRISADSFWTAGLTERRRRTEEVEHILDVSDQTPPGDGDDDDQTPPRAEVDLAAETAGALDLLGAIFGEANDWGGAESVDSDVEMAAHAVPGLLESTDFEIVPADHEPRAAQRSTVGGQEEATPVPTTTKLKDLFAPREQEGFSLIGHLDLDSELDHDMDMDHEPALPNAAPSILGAPSVVVAPTTQHGSLDASLPFFFPQKGQVRRVGFVRTEDEAQIRARWEAARGELTREWKRRHREAVKSRRRRGGERVE
ncbi:hypothetical protein EDB86DRAFT_3153477 [Lactarius hatsudake]|nr:hypothetical protein EDB86DRAFT_3153477 [Lactarius hatsudake]